uniref:Uncharacterized protein n=1 Tax=viral metagenome TaxID=1070528 RepID=A0A6C0KQI7_9ZZZZ
MSDYSSINTLIGTFSSIDDINTRSIDASNLICIDTNNNRIGINTIDPSYSIHIVDNSSVNIGIYTPQIYFDINKLPDTSNQLTKGQVYFDRSTGNLKVKL